MTLNGMIFSDGSIKHYEFDAQRLTILFQDYCDKLWLLSFEGTIAVKEQGSVGYDLFKSEIISQGHTRLLRLWDDDNNMVLSIQFSECQINPA